jgi:hypothetical protein
VCRRWADVTASERRRRGGGRGGVGGHEGFLLSGYGKTG